MKKLRLCVLSDMHGDLSSYTIPEDVDVVAVCGDIVPLSIQRNTKNSIDWLHKEFCDWANSLVCKNRILVWGNHDFVGQCYGDTYRTQMYTGLINAGFTLLEDSGVVIEGFSFYGTPYGTYPPGWAFDENADKLKKRFERIPENLDVLLTHCPPRLLWYDVVDNHRGMMHCGSEELIMEVSEKKPRYHFFGHIHEGDHMLREIRGTQYCNVSIKDEHYSSINKPFLIDICEKTENQPT